MNFPGKDAHRVHFKSPGTPRRNMVDRETQRTGASTRRSETRRGKEVAQLHVREWWFKSERPVSRARPKREQLIVMCGGRRGILIFPLYATLRVHTDCGERATKKKKKKQRGVRVVTSPPVLPEDPELFFTSFLRPRRRRRSGTASPGREEHKGDRI